MPSLVVPVPVAPGTALEDAVRDLAVPEGQLALVWIGQGGYLLKTPGGASVMIDPYFSDWAEQMWGVRRLNPPVLDLERFAPDLLVTTHWHEDHLDKPTLIRWAARDGVLLAGPESCLLRAVAWGWPEARTRRLEQGDRLSFADATLTATFARHHVPYARADDAIGVLVVAAGVTVWNVADSEYDARLRAMRAARPDVMLVPINGTGGNMNAHEAALLAWHVAPRVVVPMHYGMWAPDGYGPDATLDPATFRDTFRRLGGEAETAVLEPGSIALVAVSPVA